MQHEVRAPSRAHRLQRPAFDHLLSRLRRIKNSLRRRTRQRQRLRRITNRVPLRPHLLRKTRIRMFRQPAQHNPHPRPRRNPTLRKRLAQIIRRKRVVRITARALHRHRIHRHLFHPRNLPRHRNQVVRRLGVNTAEAQPRSHNAGQASGNGTKSHNVTVHASAAPWKQKPRREGNRSELPRAHPHPTISRSNYERT